MLWLSTTHKFLKECRTFVWHFSHLAGDMGKGILLIHTVSDLTQYIKTWMDGDATLHHISIRGELSNYKQYPSGHCYFTLKDASSCLKSVMFRSRAASLRFLPQNGMQVIATGSITVYERDGVYQLYVDRMVPEGAGELALAYEQLKERLAQEGLFRQEHKKALPAYPKRIGIVTSLAGAVLRDIYRVSKRRFPQIQLVLVPVLVQGAGAAEDISSAIHLFNEKIPVDVLIVGRGGGSMEDLWAFNEEMVVRAIYDSKIPVISAVGHETDFSLSDFVSDVRAATPSQAAELAVPDVRELIRRVQAVEGQLHRAKQHLLDSYAQRLDALSSKLPRQDFKRILSRYESALQLAATQLKALAEQGLVERKHRFQISIEKLDALNPVHVLSRGFSMIERDGKTISRAADIASGDRLTLILRDGKVAAYAE